MTVFVASPASLGGRPSRVRETLAAAGVRRWAYVGSEPAVRIALAHGALAGLEELSLGAGIQAAAERLRRPYIDWVGGLARRHDSAEWWASEIASRNSYSMVFSEVCALAAARAALADLDGTTLVVASREALLDELLSLPGAGALPSLGPHTERGRDRGATVRKGLRGWARLAPGRLVELPGRLSHGARFALDSDPRYRERVLAANGVGSPGPFEGPDTVLAFTWVDRRSFAADGAYSDPHLGMLPQLLRERGLRVLSVPRVLHGIPFAEAVRRLQASGEPVVHPDCHLEVADTIACTRRAAAYRLDLPADAEVEGVPVARIVRETIERYRGAQAIMLTYEVLVRKLAAAGIVPARVVYTHEGHSWELSMIRAARRYWPNARIVGFENLNMSRFSLSMYPAAGELDVRPLPDVLATNGRAFARILVEEGMPAERVRVGCALRHRDLRDRPVSDRTADRRPIRALVATDGTVGQAAELVEKAARALGGRAAYAVTVKCHPLVPARQVLHLLGDVALPRNVAFADDPISDLLADADVLLYTHSVVCYEALAQGVPPVFVQSESVVDLDQLEPTPHLRAEGRQPEELRAAVDRQAALAGTELAEWRRLAREAVDEALTPLSATCIDAFLG